MATSSDSNILIKMESIDDYLSENSLTTIEKFEEESNSDNSKSCFLCLNSWWNGQLKHQRFIAHIVEKTVFHVGIIILVLIDCLLVVGELMLDFIYLSEKCQNHTKSSEDEDEENHGLELSIEILHFASIGLLSIFVFEVFVKIYAFGKHWWDHRERKMEWLDAFIVFLSFAIDIYFLKKPNVIAEISLLFISFRLWRIIRIINSIAQSVRSKDEQTRRHLMSTYKQIIEVLLNVSTKKTEATSELREALTEKNLDDILDKFTSVDGACRSILAQSLLTTSQNAPTNAAHNLQETLDQIRLSSSRLSIKSQ